ncbi:15-cis-phytoene desaturase [Rubripirellula amarantea]|uniref:15-cis-phytoene desaturase n=1 Tax=Rubripirellula amarantea TaxID=2527999 RepID=A0A5C5WQB0_9BACT|nr:hydroxysqualene dehydroxylase HpnE [Rubripirellula amarantea]TWT53084.1 15-cis-phytoene desaturase [Rubripirellula amarantea]
MSNSPHERRRHLVIIGGGLAGLAAAEASARWQRSRVRQDLHWQITLLEARRQAGGRAGSFFDSASGESVDYCQHAAMGCCRELLALMQRSELLDQWIRYPELSFHHPDFPPSRFAASRWLPAPLHLSGTIGRLNYLSGNQKREVQKAMWRLIRTSTASLGDVTALQWLSEIGQSPATIANFWDVILVSALGEQTKLVSMAAARKVIVDGFAMSKGASDVFVPKVPLSQLIGNELADAVGKLGVTIRCGETAGEVRQLSHSQSSNYQPGSTSNAVSEIKLGSGEVIQADAVISAVPWYRVASLLAHVSVRHAVGDLEAIDRMQGSSITGIHCWFDRPWMKQPHAVMVGTLTQWIFRDPLQNDIRESTNEPAKGASSSKEYYCQVVISASHDVRGLPKQELMNQVLAEIHHEFPSSRNASLVRYRVVTDPRSVFSVRPGISSSRPSATTALPWLWLAGDWTDTGWPATMEGAVISGRSAAKGWMDSLAISSTSDKLAESEEPHLELQMRDQSPFTPEVATKPGVLARCLIKK